MAAALEPIGVTMKMGTIYDLRCRSVLVGERGAVVAREGCGAVCVCVLLCTERGRVQAV